MTPTSAGNDHVPSAMASRTTSMGGGTGVVLSTSIDFPPAVKDLVLPDAHRRALRAISPRTAHSLRRSTWCRPRSSPITLARQPPCTNTDGGSFAAMTARSASAVHHEGAARWSQPRAGPLHASSGYLLSPSKECWPPRVRRPPRTSATCSRTRRLCVCGSLRSTLPRALLAGLSEGPQGHTDADPGVIVVAALLFEGVQGLLTAASGTRGSRAQWRPYVGVCAGTSSASRYSSKSSGL